MQDATDFGKILRGLMVKNNLRQVELAKELEVSPAILSNYLTGKNIPEMVFLGECVKRFGLEKKELADLYYTAFSSNAETHGKIILDTSFINPSLIKTLVRFLTALVIYPKNPSVHEETIAEQLETKINDFYNGLQ